MKSNGISKVDGSICKDYLDTFLKSIFQYVYLNLKFCQVILIGFVFCLRGFFSIFRKML